MAVSPTVTLWFGWLLASSVLASAATVPVILVSGPPIPGMLAVQPGDNSTARYQNHNPPPALIPSVAALKTCLVPAVAPDVDYHGVFEVDCAATRWPTPDRS